METGHVWVRVGPSLRLLLILILGIALVVPGRVSAQASPEPAGGDGIVTASGSATLGPVLEAAGGAFQAEMPDVAVEVERSSSGAGIERFCSGEVDLGTSGRTMREEEQAACEEAGIQYLEFEVAFDGVAVVVHPDNAAVSCLTVEQLKAIWGLDSTVESWSDVDPSWPEDPLTLYGTGSESGTYQFFTQEIVGEEGVSRDDYTVTEGHPETAEAVATDPGALGFLPLPRYNDNQDRLSLVAVDSGSGCVAPDASTIQDGTYTPLSRPMYLYVNAESLQRDEVREFLEFWFSGAARYAEEGGLVPSSSDVYEANLAQLAAGEEREGTPHASPMP